MRPHQDAVLANQRTRSIDPLAFLCPIEDIDQKRTMDEYSPTPNTKMAHWKSETH